MHLALLVAGILAAWLALGAIIAVPVGKLLKARAREITPVVPPRQPDPEAAEFAAWLIATRCPHLSDERRPL